MITKTLTGVTFFDSAYGGVFRGRSWLVCGRKGTGKTLLGLQFIRQGLMQNERCLMLSGMQAADIGICAATMNLPLSESLEAGNLVLLEYNDFIPGHDSEQNLTLPPEGFAELKEIVTANAIQRVVLDTVLPWTVIRDQRNLNAHVFSFTRAFERLGTTNLLTLPKPISPQAFRLKNAIEEVVPVSIYLSADKEKHSFLWQVSKYLGERKAPVPMSYGVTPEEGLCERDVQQAPPRPSESPAIADIPLSAPRERQSGVFSRMMSIPPAPTPMKSTPPDTAEAQQESPHDPSPANVRFSSIWKPSIQDDAKETSA